MTPLDRSLPKTIELLQQAVANGGEPFEAVRQLLKKISRSARIEVNPRSNAKIIFHHEAREGLG